jgi:hypothetical protein
LVVSDIRSDIREANTAARDSFRAEIELEVDPHRANATASERAAFELALSLLRTLIIMNGWAVVAIPATVTLFGLDASSIEWQLFETAGLFVAGLVAAWLASVIGFFALAARANSKDERAHAEHVRATIKHYPRNPRAQSEWPTEANDAEEVSQRQQGRFARFRTAAVWICGLSGLLFISGALWGGYNVLQAPPRPVPPLNIHLR